MKNTDSILSSAQKDALILSLTEYIQSECSPVDMEQRFRESIDSCYDFKSVGGPFACMTPSHVLEQMDPTAFRCGVSDQSDNENAYEIEGEYYDSDKVNEAREAFVEDLQTELNEAQAELDELEEQEEEDSDPDGITEARATVARLEAQIEAVEDHTF